MELIRTLRERSQTKKQHEIQQQAEETITLSDFAGDMYIAYEGTPFVPIDESWTSKQIIEELNKLRQNYCNAKMNKSC